MPLDHARNFVEKMKEHPEFRENIMQTKSPEELAALLRGEGLQFDQRELVGAMAECMAQMEQEMGG